MGLLVTALIEENYFIKTNLSYWPICLYLMPCLRTVCNLFDRLMFHFISHFETEGKKYFISYLILKQKKKNPPCMLSWIYLYVHIFVQRSVLIKSHHFSTQHWSRFQNKILLSYWLKFMFGSVSVDLRVFCIIAI